MSTLKGDVQHHWFVMQLDSLLYRELSLSCKLGKIDLLGVTRRGNCHRLQSSRECRRSTRVQLDESVFESGRIVGLLSCRTVLRDIDIHEKSFIVSIFLTMLFERERSTRRVERGENEIA